MTEYVIFRKQESAGEEENEGWVYIGHKEARSATSAIRSFLDGSSQEGEFAAVPARSWRPVTVKVETKTALKFS